MDSWERLADSWERPAPRIQMHSIHGGSQPALGSCFSLATKRTTKKKLDGSQRQRYLDTNPDYEKEKRLTDFDDTKRQRLLDKDMDNETEQRFGLQKDRSRQKRNLERTKDYETEQCFVCRGFFKKGKGLKIHQTKAGCMKKAEEHRKAYKSEAIMVQDQNHSDLEGRVHLHHVDSKVETIGQSRHTEKEERKIDFYAGS